MEYKYKYKYEKYKLKNIINTNKILLQISFPVSYCEITYKKNKIFIFGDSHGEKKNLCIDKQFTLPEFIHKLALLCKDKYKVNFFLERENKNENKEKNNTTFSETSIFFYEKCKKNKCKEIYGNLFNYEKIDMRFDDEFELPMICLEIIEKYSYKFLIYTEKNIDFFESDFFEIYKNIFFFIKFIEKYIKNFIEKNKNNIYIHIIQKECDEIINNMNLIIKHIFTSPYIYEKISNDDINIIYNIFINKEYCDIFEYGNENENCNEKDSLYFSKKNDDISLLSKIINTGKNITNIYIYFAKITVYIMDYNLIINLMKKINNDEISFNFIYVGECHKEHIEKILLSNLEFIKINSVKNENENRCLKINF